MQIIENLAKKGNMQVVGQLIVDRGPGPASLAESEYPTRPLHEGEREREISGKMHGEIRMF